MSSISIIEHNMTERPRFQDDEKIDRWINPHTYVDQDLHEIYDLENISIGSPVLAEQFLNSSARDNTIAIVGAQFGDEGKGRLVDNKVNQLLSIPGVQSAYVIRYQGGSNAGHTIFTESGIKIPLHQIPSSIKEERAIGIMDSGMVIHMEDLRTELVDAEKIVGDLRGKLVLSEEATLITDLERAQEVVNRFRSDGRSKGGTGRGIGPGYANRRDRTDKEIFRLFEDNWREDFGQRYDRYQKEFSVHGFDLENMDVPDLRATRDLKSAQVRKVGSREEFLDRLDSVRQWYINREGNIKQEQALIQNTFLLNRNILKDMKQGVLFEGAQAIGLHERLGRLPDVTSSDTSIDGIKSGTGIWKTDFVGERIGVMKLTYNSSVGEVTMPTHIDLPRTAIHSEHGFTQDQLYGSWVREEAHERGTTTGRYRDICLLDLEIMRYHIQMGNIEALAGTHLDIAREDMPIRVCTHYEDKNGNPVPYQPGVRHQKDIKPVYIELPGWDGQAVQNARSLDEIPLNAKKYLSFVQRQTGTPIIAVTTGPERKQFIEMPNIQLPPKQYRGVAA